MKVCIIGAVSIGEIDALTRIIEGSGHEVASLEDAIESQKPEPKLIKLFPRYEFEAEVFETVVNHRGGPQKNRGKGKARGNDGFSRR